MTCHSCSRPVPEGARFCPSCGHAIAHSIDMSGDEERRVVTVLFADLVGFTTLAESRDPEQVKRLVDRAFEQLRTDVEAFGGVVDKVLGDAIVALFGAPVAHEDDAERAVRAALAMQATLRRFRADHPADAVQMRIGINTGEVLVGTVAGTDYTAMGDVVNTASRLQEHAPVGAVVVGDETRQLCSAAVRFKEFDRIQLRGRDQFTQIWQAVRHDASIVTRRWSSDVEFVGRSVELGLVRGLVAMALTGRSAVISISGEAGIGKSRLVNEVVARLLDDHPDSLLMEGACAPYGETNVWWPVAGTLMSRLGLDRARPAAENRARLVEIIERDDAIEPGSTEYERLVEVGMHLLGHPSALDDLGPTATRDAVFAGLLTGLERQAMKSPLVVWIDDLQWAAPLLLELLDTVAQRLVGMPIVIVTTHRPAEDVDLRWPPPTDSSLSLHVPLSPLGDCESVRLAKAAAGGHLPDGVIESISVRAGGNPLFLTELARLAASPELGPNAPLPGSMRALIAAQLDRLTPSQHMILDNAAIIGNEAPVASLKAFADILGQRCDDHDIATLESRGLLLVDGGVWRFRSDVVREVAYETLTKQSRAQRHAGVAKYLAMHESSMVARRAHHAATAAEIVSELGPLPGVPDTITDEAIELLSESAKKWFNQGAHRRGVELVERALALVEPDASVRRPLLLQLAGGLTEAREHQRAQGALTEASTLAEEAGDRVTMGEVYRLRGTIEQLRGDLVAARRELGLAVSIFRDLDDREHLAEALRARGFAEIFGGSLTDAEWFLGEAEELFTQAGNRLGRAWVDQHRAWVSFLSGDHAESERRLLEAIDTFEQLHDPAGTTWATGLLAFVHFFNRRMDAAETLADSVLEESKRWGDDWGASMMLELKASIHMWAGATEQARVLAEKSLNGFRKLDDRFGMIQAIGTLTRALVARGRVADAERAVEEVMVLSGSFGGLAYPLMAAAGTAMHLGQGDRAVELADEAIARLDTTGANVDEAQVVGAFGRLLVGDADGALARLTSVDVERSPFALAARATANVLIGDRESALTDVRAVEAMPEVSYWDHAVAAAAGVAAAIGEDAQHRRVTLGDHVRSVDDEMIRAYVDLVIARSLGVEPEPDDIALRGWEHLATALVP